MLKVSQQTIARWEGGAEIPSKYLKDLAIVLGCRVADLLPGSDGASGGLAARLSDEDDEQGDTPYGTARLVFMPLAGSPPAKGDEIDDDEADERYDYPIGEREMRRLRCRLAMREDKATWFGFETLDNRDVYVNRSALESFQMIGDDVIQMPSFDHEEVYRALSDHKMRDILEGRADPEELAAEDAPYSDALVERCLELVEEWGGLEETFDRMSSITIETLAGRRESLLTEDEALQEVGLLGIEIDSSAFDNDSPMSEWMYDLCTEGYYRTTYYRLGALRLIEVPLLAVRESNRRAMEEAPAKEDTDGGS